MSAAAVLLAATRGVHLMGVLSVFGVCVAQVTGIAGHWRRRDPLLIGGVAAAWLVAPWWLALQAGEMSGATTLLATLAAMPTALCETGFGHSLMLRLALLAGVGVLAQRPSLPARLASVLLAAGACLAQLDMGHAAAPDGAWQRLAAASHVLAAGAWIGGLVPLLRGLGDDPLAARSVAQRFSLLGSGAVAVLGTSAVIQGMILGGGLPGLLGTAYGTALLTKTALFIALLLLATYHRFGLVPALAGDMPARALWRLRRSIAIEAVIGAIAVAVASWLAGLPPGAHEQPIWPLTWQLSPDAWDDPEIASRVVGGLMSCGAALAVGVAAAQWRRRAPLSLGLAMCALAGIACAAVLAVPVLGAFAVPAYPTSFFESPTGFSKASVAAGQPLFATYCASCHGARGFGDGPAVSVAARPAPLTGFHLLQRSDGEMFWILTAGIPATSMPGFGTALDEEQRWILIDYVRFLAGAEPADVAHVSHHHH